MVDGRLPPPPPPGDPYNTDLILYGEFKNQLINFFHVFLQKLLKFQYYPTAYNLIENL